MTMTLIYESFLRQTHSGNIQEWFQDLKSLLSNLEEVADPSPEDIQLAFHLNQMVENFELMESNLVERRRDKNQDVSDLLDRDRSFGTSKLFR
jgi:competence protein ComGF